MYQQYCLALYLFNLKVNPSKQFILMLTIYVPSQQYQFNLLNLHYYLTVSYFFFAFLVSGISLCEFLKSTLNDIKLALFK